MNSVMCKLRKGEGGKWLYQISEVQDSRFYSLEDVLEFLQDEESWEEVDYTSYMELWRGFHLKLEDYDERYILLMIYKSKRYEVSYISKKLEEGCYFLSSKGILSLNDLYKESEWKAFLSHIEDKKLRETFVQNVHLVPWKEGYKYMLKHKFYAIPELANFTPSETNPGRRGIMTYPGMFVTWYACMGDVTVEAMYIHKWNATEAMKIFDDYGFRLERKE